MTYLDIQNARADAQRQIQLADQAVCGAVRLIAGRLKAANVSSHLLADLKRELSNFNARTGEWK